MFIQKAVLTYLLLYNTFIQRNKERILNKHV